MTKNYIVIQDWMLIKKDGDDSRYLAGLVYDHPNHDDESFIISAKVVRVELDKEEVETYDGFVFKLGQKHPEFEQYLNDRKNSKDSEA